MPPLDEKFSLAIDYALKVLLADCGDFERLRRHITYGENPGEGCAYPHLCIRPSDFFSRYGQPTSLPNEPLAAVDGIPLIYGTSGIQRTVEPEGAVLHVEADLVASAFFMLGRYEEMILAKENAEAFDQFGRFIGASSLAYRAGFLDRPVVDEYAELLRRWLREIGVDVAEPDRRFSVLMSHDIDAPHRFNRIGGLGTILRDLLKRRRSVAESLSNAGSFVGLARDPYDNFDMLLTQGDRLRKAFGADRFRHLFFIIAGGEEWIDAPYDFETGFWKKIQQQIDRPDVELGLHSSFSASLDPKRIAQEKARLESVLGRAVEFNRHHYLGWRNVADAAALAHAGFAEDSTLGFAGVAGFRLGVCRPVPLFDPVNLCELETIEHPLMLMDRSIESPQYMNLSLEAAREYSERLIAQTQKHRGEFVFLWHNSIFHDDVSGYHATIFKNVVDMLIESA